MLRSYELCVLMAHYRRQPDSVAALLAAGATTDGITLPTGYDAIDTLLHPRMNPPQIR